MIFLSFFLSKHYNFIGRNDTLMIRQCHRIFPPFLTSRSLASWPFVFPAGQHGPRNAHKPISEYFWVLLKIREQASVASHPA